MDHEVLETAARDYLNGQRDRDSVHELAIQMEVDGNIQDEMCEERIAKIEWVSVRIALMVSIATPQPQMPHCIARSLIISLQFGPLNVRG